MIIVTRLNGPEFALNPDIIERADSTPDTVITLVDGTKYVIAETLAEFISLVRQYRASVIAQAQVQVHTPGDTHVIRRAAKPAASTTDSGTNVVPLNRRER